MQLADGEFSMRIAVAPTTALLLGTGACFAQAQPQGLSQPTTTPASTSTPADAANNQNICKMMYHNGSLVRTQTCHTKAEWEAVRQANRQEVEQQQMRGLMSSPH
jgi:hypothetical protein